MKYRIVQKGDQYNPQYKGWLFWNPYTGYGCDTAWITEHEACAVISAWKRQDKFDSSHEIVLSPKDICKDCQGEK